MSVFRITSYITGMAAVAVVFSLLHTPTATAADYDIPLTELNKVKKKYPTTVKSRERRKTTKKQGEQSQTHETEPAKQQTTPATATVLPTDIPQPAPLQPRTKPEQAGSAFTANQLLAAVTITHEPYSYLTPGHRTSLLAVLSSNEPLANVTCSFHAHGATSGATTQMTRVAGTRFTYTTIIPALAATTTGLNYRINAYTDSGVAVQSRDYEIPVSSTTTIVPGWQIDHFSDSLELQIDTENTTLDGFSDPALLHTTGNAVKGGSKPPNRTGSHATKQPVNNQIKQQR